MEKNEHGVPVLSEEEAAERAAEKAELQNAADVVQEVIPGATVIEDGDDNSGDAFAGGQAIQGGDIVHTDPILGADMTQEQVDQVNRANELEDQKELPQADLSS